MMINLYDKTDKFVAAIDADIPTPAKMSGKLPPVIHEGKTYVMDHNRLDFVHLTEERKISRIRYQESRA
jgi:hypothetical protein